MCSSIPPTPSSARLQSSVALRGLSGSRPRQPLAAWDHRDHRWAGRAPQCPTAPYQHVRIAPSISGLARGGYLLQFYLLLSILSSQAISSSSTRFLTLSGGAIIGRAVPVPEASRAVPPKHPSVCQVSVLARPLPRSHDQPRHAGMGAVPGPDRIESSRVQVVGHDIVNIRRQSDTQPPYDTSHG